MGYKDYYDYEDIMRETGKSLSSVKKWRLKVEELSGYTFKKVRMRVSRKRVRDVYQFSEEEFNKFVCLSKRIEETNNLAKSVVDIWGDLKLREEQQLRSDVKLLLDWVEELSALNKQREMEVSFLRGKLAKVEERLVALEEQKSQKWRPFKKA